MTENGFWTGGPDEHRRALEQHVVDLKKRLENSDPDEREQTAREIAAAEKELQKSRDDQILW